MKNILNHLISSVNALITSDLMKFYQYRAVKRRSNLL